KTGNHIVRGDDDIVISAAVFQLGIEDLVAVRSLIVDGDAGFLLELGDKIGVDIFAPAAHVDNTTRTAGAAGEEQSAGHHSGQRQGKCLFQLIIPPINNTNLFSRQEP